jgi:hypothetical protein
MKTLPALVAWVSFPIYFCGLNLILFWYGRDNDAIGVILAVLSFPLFGISGIAALLTFVVLSLLVGRRASERTEEGRRRTKNISGIVGVISVLIYLCGLLLFSFSQYQGPSQDRGLVFVIAFFPVFAISVMGGIITGLITFAVLSLFVDRPASESNDAR